MHHNNYDYIYFYLFIMFANAHRLGLNAIGDEGARCIAEALRQNSSQSVKDI